MFNVNQITSQLARMPDQALQQYAMLHKNDPYTVSLALAESNRRKEMRTAATPMPGQMPKVVDQDIAQMMPPAQQQLPENVGIGQLPAKNMQGMADGGIVGYSGKDEDQVVRNPYAFLNPGDMWDAVQRWRASGQPLLPYLGVPTTRVVQPKLTAQQERDLNIAQAQALNTASTDGYTRPAMSNDPRLPAGYQTTTPAVSTPPTATSTTPPTASSASGSPFAALTPNAGQGIKVGTPAGLPSVDAAFNKLLGVMPKEKTVEEEKSFTEKRLAPYAEVDAKAADFINKQKDQLKTDREQEFYMSLIEGGLAAAGESGPNAIQNISKGFSKGVGRYGEALKDFRKAAQENSKMELELAKAQADRKVGNMDKYQERIDKADEYNKSLATAKASGLATLLGQDIHGKYQLESTRQHVAGQLAAHAMPTGVERMVNQMPGATFEEKLKGYSGIMGADARGESALLTKYMGMNPAEKMLFKQQNPQLAAMFDMQLQNAMLKPTNKPTGPIRD